MTAYMSRVSNAVAAAVEDAGTRDTAEALGVGKSSVSRWGDDLNAWSAAALLTLAKRNWTVRSAILAMLSEAPVTIADPRRATADIATALPTLLAEAQIMATAMADGRVSRAEARTILSALPNLSKQLEQLQTDLAALLRSEVA